MPARRESRGRIGLALAGGGALAAVYEIGALVALEDCIEGLDLTSLWSYVGVSAGSVVASCLANGIKPREMRDALMDRASEGAAFRPEIFYTPAHRELTRRGLMLPGLIAGALRDFATGRSRPSLGEAMLRLARALPAGVFDNEPIRRHFHALFTRDGRTDDFRELGRRLTVVAADLDTGEPLRFGAAGRDDVPISQAIQASTAVPGVYPPVHID